jgi:hypothetical protein
MRYLVNGTLRPGRTHEEFTARIEGKLLSHEVWELIRKGVITEHGFKVGPRLGFVFVIEGDSEEKVLASLSDIPLIREGWFDVEIDAVSPFLSDIH